MLRIPLFNIELRLLNYTDNIAVLKYMLYTRGRNYRSSERKKNMMDL